MPSDRVHELSLRILTTVVGLVLVGCVLLLVQRWTRPAALPADAIPVSTVQAVPVQPAVRAEVPVQQVLLVPGRVFRCESGGSVSFSEQPCPAR